MAKPFRFVPDPTGIKAVSSGPGVAPILDQAATNAAGRMRRNAAGLTREAFFEFRDSIEVVKCRHGDPSPTAYAGSKSPGWHLQEFGTARQRARAILRRSIKAVGLRFEGSSR